MALGDESYHLVVKQLMWHARGRFFNKHDIASERDQMLFMTTGIPQPEKGEGSNTWEEVVDRILEFYA